MAVPGVASTLLLVAAGLQMSTEVGTSLLSADQDYRPVTRSLGNSRPVAYLVYPFHPRHLGSPQNAATLILLVGAGLYLLARVQGIAPVLTGHAWMLSLSWRCPSCWWPFCCGRVGAGGAGHPPNGTGSGSRLPSDGNGTLVSVGLVCALGILAIWWDTSLEEEKSQRPGWLQWFAQGPALRGQAETRFEDSMPAQEGWRETRYSNTVSFCCQPSRCFLWRERPLQPERCRAGPCTAGSWRQRGGPQLLLVLVADTFLVVGLWAMFRRALEQSAGGGRRGRSCGDGCFRHPGSSRGVAPGFLTTSLSL